MSAARSRLGIGIVCILYFSGFLNKSDHTQDIPTTPYLYAISLDPQKELGFLSYRTLYIVPGILLYSRLSPSNVAGVPSGYVGIVYS